MEKTTGSYDATSQSTKTAAQTMRAVSSAGAGTPVILDFDETLFLRNSTEAYLDAVYPRPLGATALVALKAIRPWRWFPEQYREDDVAKDWFLVVAMTLLFPWTRWVWQGRAKKLANAYSNRTLIQAVEANPQAKVVIATLGFDLVVMPLIRHLPMDLGAGRSCQVIACRFWQGLRDRARGKRAMVTEALGKSAVGSAVAVTDAQKDWPLLSAVATPCLLTWPEAKFIPAMADVYVPLFYSEKVKNPKNSHIAKRVLMGHWAFLVIALSFLSPHPVINALSLLLLTFSYWCVYEVGYQENDLIGEKYESKPILSETYIAYKSRINLTNIPAPWYAAMGIAIPGLLLLEVSQRSAPISSTLANLGELWSPVLFGGLIWMALLVAVRLTFWVYNQFNEEARIWIYPILQIQKLFGFTLLAGTNVVGALLLLSLLLCRWLHYSIYRCGGDRWRFPINLSCFVLFSIMFCGVALGSPEPLSLLTLQAFVALGYCLIRALKGWRKLYPRFELLARPPAVPERSKVVLVPPDDSTHIESSVQKSSLIQALHNRGSH